jgi:hypothetical protein
MGRHLKLLLLTVGLVGGGLLASLPAAAQDSKPMAPNGSNPNPYGGTLSLSTPNQYPGLNGMQMYPNVYSGYGGYGSSVFDASNARNLPWMLSYAPPYYIFGQLLQSPTNRRHPDDEPSPFLKKGYSAGSNTYVPGAESNPYQRADSNKYLPQGQDQKAKAASKALAVGPPNDTPQARELREALLYGLTDLDLKALHAKADLIVNAHRALGERQLQALIQEVNADAKANEKAQEATARLQALRVLRPGDRVVGVRDGKIYAMLGDAR